mmetsp:Transcript_2900/g.12459  ORF Transcript_2900/g.12459 Transcript_2900/m.12459 type:complete len:349 (+) Transcript_2900:206-1252(+)
MSWAQSLWKQYDPINRIMFPAQGRAASYDVKGKPFVGELQVRDVVYKTIVVHMPVHVPGGMCAPPVRIDVPCMIVLRADLGTVDPNTRRKSNRCRARCTVVYLHGNGTDIGGVAEEAKALSRDLECHVVVPEYPGYGLAGGSANEDSVDAATHAGCRVATECLGTPLERLIVYGRSVGTGPAAAAAARMSARNKPPCALVLHSPYTSIRDYATEKAGAALGALLVSERWPTKRNLARVRCPILLIHGDRDEVIPFRHSARLKRESKGYKAPCHLHVQKGGAHNDFDFFGDVLDPLAMFLRRHERGPWTRGGGEAPEMGLDLRDISSRVAAAGPGDVDEYPFASADKEN